MSAPSPTHYEVLGVTPSATQQEIKKRYRELARSHHPDVAATPDAANRFREIAEANRILSDPSLRANYDAELKLSARLQAARSAPNGASPRPASPGSNSRPGSATPQAKPKHSASEKRAAEVRQLLESARKSLALLRYREAEELCRSAIGLDGRSSIAYELLGDILNKRRGPDEALAMYSFAVQLDRNNRDAQQKLDRIVGRPSGATMAGSAARATRAPAATRIPFGPARERLGVTALSAVLLPILLYVVASARHPMATSPWFFQWDPLLCFALAACATTVGLTAAANNWLLPAKAVFGGGKDSRAGGSFLAPALVVGSLLFFHAVAVVYLLLARIHGPRSRSVLGALLTTYGLIGLFAIAAGASGRYLLGFGGNLLFPSFLLGWSVGDKMQGRMG